MALYRTEGIVLRTRPLGEADKITVILSRSAGKVSAVARGARRTRSRLLGATQPFTWARYLLYRGRELDTLSQAEVVEAFRPLREDLGRMALASYAAELVDLLVPEGEAAEPVFLLLLDLFQVLASHRGHSQEDSGIADGSPALRAFELQLLGWSGYQPELERCARCGGSLAPPLRFDVAAGGVTCGRCLAGGFSCTPEQVAWLRHLASALPSQAVTRPLPAGEGARIEQLLRAFVSAKVERPLRSLAFLEAVRGAAPAAPATPADPA